MTSADLKTSHFSDTNRYKIFQNQRCGCEVMNQATIVEFSPDLKIDTILVVQKIKQILQTCRLGFSNTPGYQVCMNWSL